MLMNFSVSGLVHAEIFLGQPLQGRINVHMERQGSAPPGEQRR